MKVERMILLAFFGNYLLNNIVAGLASLVPATQGAANPYLSAQYITYVVLAAVAVGLISWWYLMRMPRAGALMQGVVFGVVAFVVAVLTALVTGIAGVLLQTGSLAQVGAVLPNFGPYLVSTTTLILAGLWIVPSALVGWLMQSRMKAAPAPMAGHPVI